MENRSFKTSAKPIFNDSEINDLIEHSFTALLNEEEVYLGKGSGYVFQCIDSLLLKVYKYTPTDYILDIRLPIIRDDNDEDDNNNNNNNNN